MKRIEHIAGVLAVAPLLYGIDLVLRSLNGVPSPNETFSRFLWEAMWEDLT